MSAKGLDGLVVDMPFTAVVANTVRDLDHRRRAVGARLGLAVLRFSSARLRVTVAVMANGWWIDVGHN